MANFAPGLGVFETLRVERGCPFFVPEHRAQMRRAAQALGLTDPVFPKMPRLPEDAWGRWRWIYVSGEKVEFLFTSESLFAIVPGAQHTLELSPLRLGSQNWDARFKTLSYLTHLQARKIASTPQVVLLNEHGQVASAASANIFWRHAGQIYTPALEVGCRAGIVRSWILRERPETIVGGFPLDFLLEADEIFVTNSLKGIISMARFAGKSLTDYSTADALRVELRKEMDLQLHHFFTPLPPDPAIPRL